MTTRRSILKSAAALGASALVPSIAFAGGHGRLGKFEGVSGHATSGQVEISGDTVTLLEDFQFDGAPDPKVALGRDGYDKSTLMGLLKSNSGKQSFTVPAGIDTAGYNEVWIWCEKFNVPLGVAKIN